MWDSLKPDWNVIQIMRLRFKKYVRHELNRIEKTIESNQIETTIESNQIKKQLSLIQSEMATSTELRMLMMALVSDS